MTPFLSVLARAFVPSWRFFDGVVAAPLLERQVMTDAGSSAWERVVPPVPRTLARLILNPAGNVALALHGLADRLADEAASSAPERAVTERLVWHAVRASLPPALRGDARARVVWRLVDPASGAELLRSAEAPCAG